MGGSGDGDLLGGERRRLFPSFDREGDLRGGGPMTPVGLELLDEREESLSKR